MVAGAAGVAVARTAAASSSTTTTNLTTARTGPGRGALRVPLRPCPALRARTLASAATNAAPTGSDDVSAPSSSAAASASAASSSSSSTSSPSARAPRRDWRPNAFQKNDDELHTLLNSISPIERGGGSVLLARAPALLREQDEAEAAAAAAAEDEMEQQQQASRRASSSAATTSFSPSPSPRPPVTSAPPGVSSRPRSPPPEAYGSSPLWTPHPLSDDDEGDDEGDENVAAAFRTEDEGDDDDDDEFFEEGRGGLPPSSSAAPPSTSLPTEDDSGATQQQQQQQQQQRQPPKTTTPVYVMLPLDTVWLPDDPEAGGALLTRGAALEAALRALAAAGVTGVAVDVWWGIAEAAGPGKYDFDAYARLFDAAAAAGLKVSATMSFHAAGGNVGDTCTVPLPPWVLAAGEKEPDMFYTDAAGHRNRECLSLGADEVECLPAAAAGFADRGGDDEGGASSSSSPPPMRTPVRAYADFVSAFATRFRGVLARGIISEVTVGLGPAGELRYPSYPEGDGRWRFPGVGAFQCYDAHMKRSLASAALEAGEPAWGHGAPHDAGWYNSTPWDAPFFAEHGRWDSDYGRFFLEWYSGCLARHADLVLGACREALDGALLEEEGMPRGAGAASGAGAFSFFSSSDSDSSSSSSSERRRRRRGPLHRRLLGLVGRGGGSEDNNGGAEEEQDGDDESRSPSSILAPSLSPSSSLGRSSSRQRLRRRPRLGAKLAGVHWWYGHPSHAAELTAGYYNVYHRDGYLPLLDVLAAHGAAASLTCVEMRDCEHPPHAHCRPQALLDQVVAAASVAGSESHSSGGSSSSGNGGSGGVPLAGENALQRYDDAAASALVERAASLSQLTFLRMGDLMFDNWGAFAALLARLRVRE